TCSDRLPQTGRQARFLDGKRQSRAVGDVPAALEQLDKEERVAGGVAAQPACCELLVLVEAYARVRLDEFDRFLVREPVEVDPPHAELAVKMGQEICERPVLEICGAIG